MYSVLIKRKGTAMKTSVNDILGKHFIGKMLGDAIITDAFVNSIGMVSLVMETPCKDSFGGIAESIKRFYASDQIEVTEPPVYDKE